jgi:hypothetical protein
MNMDDKIVVGDSGEGIAEVGGGTDEGVGGVYAGTNVATCTSSFSALCLARLPLLLPRCFVSLHG